MIVSFAVMFQPWRKDWRARRLYHATFRKPLPPDTELVGKPLVIRTRKSLFYIPIVSMLLMLLCVVFISVYYCVTLAPDATAMGFLTDFITIFALFTAAFILLMLKGHLTRLDVYQNGLVWHGFWRNRTVFFHELDGLRLRKPHGGKHDFNAYEFICGDKVVIRLFVQVYVNPDVLEKLFNIGHPCVANVVNDRDIF